MFGRDEKVSGTRLTAVQYIILGVFLILAYGLWRLQVVQSDFYSALAEKNKTREVPILAPRGKILDREGRVIVDNYPSFSALLLRDSTRDLSGDADMIARDCTWIRRKSGSGCTSLPARRSTSPSISRKTSHRTNWLSSSLTTTNCPNWTPSWRIAGCIRATGSWRT